MKDRKQIEKMTAKEAMQRMNKAMAHGMDLRVTDSPVRVPGRIGICRTAKGNFMVYVVADGGKLERTSVHGNRREANGRALERALAICGM